MSAAIPEDAQRLADRLRALAVEVESAARFGIPIPFGFSVSGHEYGRATFAATAEEFDAWAEYTEAEVEDYEHEGEQWRSGSATIGEHDLRIQFACVDPEQVSA